jgi:hypothetical protein
MTLFQITALVFFGVVLFVSYRAHALAAIRNLWSQVPGTTAAKRPVVNLVQDLMTIDNLRNRLTALGCKEGADACTTLLKVMIEFDYQAPKVG